MPEKDGTDEKKTTKEVVNKKQKQMMGEEGYDHLRDMGRVRPSKDKKDATTMPPSKEMEKTRKVNKGPSALERVKKKYKGQIMDVKKEELDLTQVAEAFGGFIVEAPKKPKPGSFEFSRELGPKGKFQTSNIVKRMMQAFPPPGTKVKVGSVDKIDVEAEKRILDAQTDSNLKKLDNIDKAEDKVLDKVNKPKVTTSRGQIVQGNIFGGQDDASKKGRKKRSDAGKKRGKPNRRRYFADPNTRQLQIDFTKKAHRQQVKQDVAKVVKDPVRRALVPTVKKTGKGILGLLAKAKDDPITTAVGAGIARDQVSGRRPRFPSLQVPTVKGGKVGKRTAG